MMIKAISKSEMVFFVLQIIPFSVQHNMFLEIGLCFWYNDKLIVSDIPRKLRDVEYLMISVRFYRMEHRRMNNALV